MLVLCLLSLVCSATKVKVVMVAAHTCAPTLVIAEKAAEIITEDLERDQGL